MGRTWLSLLLLSGLVSGTALSVAYPAFVLLRTSMNWTQAQSFCRNNHVDLATVQRPLDFSVLSHYLNEEKMFAPSWIGLYVDNDHWFWSLRDEPLQYSASAAPAWPRSALCAGVHFNGSWLFHRCSDTRPFFCVDEQPHARQRVVRNEIYVSWREAQVFCRTYYTDLLTIRNETENHEVTRKIAELELELDFWIGLNNGVWRWSGGVNLTGSTRSATERLTAPGRYCATIRYPSLAASAACGDLSYPLCSTIREKLQVVRVEVNSGEQILNATLASLFLNKIQNLLQTPDFSNEWRIYSEGKIFQKKPAMEPEPVKSRLKTCND